MSLWKKYLRWRHSHGFGVHSPFAYRYITEVLRPGNYGYYVYHEIEHLARGEKENKGRFIRDAKFLARLAIFLKAKRILSPGKTCQEARLAARALKIVFYGFEPGSKISFKPGDLLVFNNDTVSPEVIEEALKAKAAVMASEPSTELRKILENPIPKGVLFNGSHNIVLIPREEMEYVAYDI